MNGVEIRKYVSTDRESCRGLWRELTEWHRELYHDPLIGGSCPEDYFDQHLAKVGPDRLWIAVWNTQVIGLSGLVLNGEEGEIEPLIVKKAFRRHGIGTRLITFGLTEARKLGVRLLKVAPVARNVKAIQFFYRQGFTNVGEIALYIDLSRHVQWKKGLKLFDRTFSY